MNVFTPVALRRTFAFAALICSTVLTVFAAEEKRRFDVPAGDAAQTLKQFASQAKREIVFAPDAVGGVQTKAVTGELAPREALDRMLADTGLAASQDKKTGAFAVKRDPGPNASGAAPAKVSDRPERETKEPRDLPPSIGEQGAANTDVVQLEKFTVSTALGTYVESESSAGSKVPMNMRELASTVQVLNASFISDLKAKELDDLYPYVVGMTRQLRTSTGFTLRGFSALGASLASVQVDGLPGLATRFGSPTTANIDRVEVLKGPTSVLYGQNNPGGLINMVSKRPQAKAATDLMLSVSSYAGTNSPLGDDLGFITQIDSTGPIDSDKKWLYRAIVSYERLDGFRRNDYFKNFYIFPSLTYRWNEHTSLTFQGDITQQKRRADDGLVAPFSDVGNVARYDLVYQEPGDVERDEGAGLSALFQHHLSNGWTFKLAGRSVWHTDTKLALENGTIVSATPVQNSTHRRRYRDNYNARRFNFVDSNLYGKFGSDNIRHTLLFGASYGREFSDIYRKSFTQVGWDPLESTCRHASLSIL